MNSIAQKLSAITEDRRHVDAARRIDAARRADWLFDTKAAADAVGCHPRKFGDWWHRTQAKLIELYIAQPGQLAAEVAAIFARAEAERQKRLRSIPHPTAHTRDGLGNSR